MAKVARRQAGGLHHRGRDAAIPKSPRRSKAQDSRLGKKTPIKIAFEPIFGLPAVRALLQGKRIPRATSKLPRPRCEAAAFRGVFDFPGELRGSGNTPVRQKQRYDPDWDVAKKDSTARPVVRVIQPEGGPIKGAVTMAMLLEGEGRGFALRRQMVSGNSRSTGARPPLRTPCNTPKKISRPSRGREAA